MGLGVPIHVLYNPVCYRNLHGYLFPKEKVVVRGIKLRLIDRSTYNFFDLLVEQEEERCRGCDRDDEAPYYDPTNVFYTQKLDQ